MTQDDALPKVVCHDCWNHIDMFHSFVQRIIAVREDYLRQPSDVCAKVENEEDTFGAFRFIKPTINALF